MDKKEMRIRNWKAISGFVITVVLFAAIILLIWGIKKVDPPILRVLFNAKTESPANADKALNL